MVARYKADSVQVARFARDDHQLSPPTRASGSRLMATVAIAVGSTSFCAQVRLCKRSDARLTNRL